MLKTLTFALAATLATGAYAQSADSDSGRSLIGIGRIFDNDQFGDGLDRWRSGSYSLSVMTARNWTGDLSSRPLDLLEYRIHSEIIAPGRIYGPGMDDRAYAGVLSFGVHTHFSAGPADITLGTDLVMIGPATGVMDLQDWFHEAFGFAINDPFVRANQVANTISLTGTAEAAFPIHLSPSTTLRPFVEVQYGAEDLARVGFDMFVGSVGHNDVFARDIVTGQVYRAVEAPEIGFGFVLGADYTYLFDSVYFPASFGTDFEPNRYRARVGLHWQIAEQMSYFYGLTYLSEEYIGQPEGQVVGSLKLNFNF